MTSRSISTGQGGAGRRRRQQPRCARRVRDDPEPAAGSDSGSGSGIAKQDDVFSPLGLQIPAMKQLSEGVQALRQEKGYEVMVQDPKLDPQKQVTDLQSVIDTGKAAASGPSWSRRRR